MIPLLATSAFGIESIVRYELSQLGYEARIIGPGRIEFCGDESAIIAANLWLRTADRVLIVVGRFAAPDFDALFETTKSLPWEDWITASGEFPVNGRSRKSQLTSVPAVQRTVKRAIVDRLRMGHGVEELPENGPRFGVEIALLDDQATLTLDTTGPSLHKRGYRQLTGQAPLKETLAAALVQLSFWSEDRPLIDPFCGTGTIPIEAALLGRNIAPGLNRSFPCEEWAQFDSRLWNEARNRARAAILPSLSERIVGTDSDTRSLQLARQIAEKAGVSEDIHFQQRSFEKLSSRRQYGCVITNPPYGHRLGDTAEAEAVHRQLPIVLRALPTWSHFILTALPHFEDLIQKKADRRRKLYNGRIECTYYQFHGPKPGTGSVPSDSLVSDAGDGDAPQAVPAAAERRAFGGLTGKDLEQFELFRTRLLKRARHLRRWPTKKQIHCYRLYERDIPEIPLIVDRYEDHLHITEYERPHSRSAGQHADWLDRMQETAAEALEIEPEKVFLKSRHRQRGTSQHERMSDQRYEIAAREGQLQFLVNLSDYVDTGLFLDHRITRSMVRDVAADCRVLNLFGYTGTFSVYAADGGARSITTVDLSRTYLDWARRNHELNGFRGSQYTFVQQDARSYLSELTRRDQFELAIVDPPTFSNSKRTDEDWQIERDHIALLRQVLQHTCEGGRIYFSTNSRSFKFREDELAATAIRDISRQTVPEDFRNRRIHRCWLIEK